MIELVAVLMLIGILAVVAVPKFDAALSMRSDTAHDEVVAALRYASQTAQSHRRLVCATVSASAVTLAIATSRGASACDTSLVGANGSASYTTNAGNTALGLSPAGTIFFQPDGRATSDGAGTSASTRSLTVSGSTSITILGETGLVR